MNISTIQKRKFLNNIYKLFYSTGKKPSDHEVRRAFNQYFSVNEFGRPVRVDTAELQTKATTDPHVLNTLMANTLLNLEVLYDCVMENNEEIFSVINTMNNKLDNLRAKRKELESKIDQLIYANSNSDGFFYSYLENFANTSNVDLQLSNAFIDTVNNHATIPKLTTQIGSALTTRSIAASVVKKTITYNNQNVLGPINVENFDLVFDGLNDTYWSHSHRAQAPGIVSVMLDIPINSGFTISRFQGSIISETPCSVFVKAYPAASNAQPVIRTQDSKGDYNRFAFTLPNDVYTSISITMFKNEPDRLVKDPTTPYEYTFGIRELTIGADYYDERAQLVSTPISIPTSDNRLLSISSISLDAHHQVVPGTSISYFVAADVPSAQGISEFNWIPIEPSNFGTEALPTSVDLMSSNFYTEYIDTPLSDASVTVNYPIIPLNTTAENVNEMNPISLPFSDKVAYRVASLNNVTEYRQPYMLAGIDSFRSYWISTSNSKVPANLSKTLSGWADIINQNTSDLRTNIVKNTTSVFVSSFAGPASEILETKLLSDQERTASHTVVKTGAFSMSIYLNGALIADIPTSQTTAKVEWNFVKGINSITIAYDNDSTSKVTVDLMVGANLNDYGIVFLDYYSYLDPIEFRRRVDTSLSVFTIDTVYGSKQVLASREISKRTILRYYSDRSQEVTAVRYRVDLNRYSDPLQTPILDAVRVKFKHVDI